jgi:hypothetical protein
MAGEAPRPEFEIHGGGLDLRFPHHENELAQSGRAAIRSRDLAAQRDARARRREDVEVARERGHAAERARHVGARDAAALPHERALAEAGGLHDESLESVRTQLAGFREALALPVRAAADWEQLEAVLEDDFNTPAALALLHVWASRGARDELGAGLDLFGLQTEFEVPAEIEAARAARGGARGEGLGGAMRRATRSRRPAGR